MRHESFDSRARYGSGSSRRPVRLSFETVDGAKTEVELDGPAEHVEEARSSYATAATDTSSSSRRIRVQVSASFASTARGST